MLCALLALLVPGRGAVAHSQTEGVVVEKVSTGSAAEAAGIRPGDRILSWSRLAAAPANPRPARGRIGSPFELSEVLLEQAPRGPVVLVGQSGGKKARWRLDAEAWGLKSRPPVSPDLFSVFEETRASAAAKDLERAAQLWRSMAQAPEIAANASWAAWCLAELARAFADEKKWAEADAAFTEALDELPSDDTAVRLQISREWGLTFSRRQDWTRAIECYERALALSRRRATGSLSIAQIEYNLGYDAAEQGDTRTMERHFREALAIREALAPGSLALATSLNGLGVVSHDRGDLAAAEGYYLRALTIQERRAPDSAALGRTFSNLGALADSRGDLATAEQYHRRALALFEKLAPDSLELGSVLNNTAIVLRQRGDLAAAEEYHQRCLVIKQKLAPDSLVLAMTLNNLAVMARDRGEPAVAEELLRRALAIKEKVAPQSATTAGTLNNLGVQARERGDPDAAEAYHRRALALDEKLAPEGLEVAASLDNLGDVAADRGDLRAAEEQYRRALAIREKLAPGSLAVAITLVNLGQIAAKRADWSAAEGHHRRALEIRAALAPGSQDEAESLHALAQVYRDTGRPSLAVDFLSRAVDALEKQTSRLGGSAASRSDFAAKYAAYYRECIEALVERGRAAEAFHVLERSRARSLLMLLAERDLLFSMDVPAEMAREGRRIDAEYDRVQEELAGLSPTRDGAKVQQLLDRLRELGGQRDEIARRLRKASPRFASLRYPEPLDLAGARGALDPGTLLLSYSVGREKTVLFGVQAGDPAASASDALLAIVLPVGEEVLRAKVRSFRSAIQSTQATPDTLRTLGRELYETLLNSASALIAASQRVVISPDGPLHTLPFAALVPTRVGSGGTRDGAYLAEWKPLHTVISATAYAALRKRERPQSPPSGLLAAFGDPIYLPTSRDQAGRIADAELRPIVSRGRSFQRLPFTRKEVEAIAGLYGEKGAAYLAEQATETRVKSLGSDIRYLHFACHAVLDEQLPLNSALVLSVPEKTTEGDNGLLQAWEVFEKMRIDADLVTLSACETALGQERGGEGLVGLTLAFQYAGARSILASLWQVSDSSTAELMRRFYGYVREGRPKDEALRSAQLDLIRNYGPRAGGPGRAIGGLTTQGPGEACQPFHWAAFALYGDWR
jgi:CHAT domain-containing protein/Tfp pilus assembly protein PilF